jgi:O-Antigen ligase
MKQTRFLSLSSSQKHQDNDTLFQGIWLRWRALIQPEKVVCMGIILIPLWWYIGWGIMPLFWVISIAFYEIWCHHKIRLSRPSIEATAIILFAVHSIISYILNSPSISPSGMLVPFYMWGCSGLLLWYIQSHKIRVRLQVVAWAFSVVICMMLLWWMFFHFVLSEPYFVPPRTLYAIIFDKGIYNPSQFGSVGNFLVPYYYGEKGFGGLYRYTFFFPHPTTTSFAIGWAGLIALDIKKRIWSLPIVGICSFLILICQARNAWLAIPIVLFIRWLFTTGRTKGLAFLFVLLAITSFATLSVPAITDWITETQSNTVEATSKFRKESTETRHLIYQRTWENIVEEPSFLGHGLKGPPVQPGYEFAALGTESFILGTLLYKSGLLGTGIFLTFLTSFLVWLYNTRKDRPFCCFLMLLYFSLTSLVTEYLVPEVFIILLCAMLQDVKENQLISTSAKRRK